MMHIYLDTIQLDSYTMHIGWPLRLQNQQKVGQFLYSVSRLLCIKVFWWKGITVLPCTIKRFRFLAKLSSTSFLGRKYEIIKVRLHMYPFIQKYDQKPDPRHSINKFFGVSNHKQTNIHTPTYMKNSLWEQEKHTHDNSLSSSVIWTSQGPKSFLSSCKMKS